MARQDGVKGMGDRPRLNTNVHYYIEKTIIIEKTIYAIS